MDPVVFSGSSLDRVPVERRDEAWLAGQLADEKTRFLPLWRLDLLVRAGGEGRLAWARRELFAGLDPEPEAVLLGREDGVAHFAVDVSSLAEPLEALGLDGLASFEDLRGVASRLAVGDAAIAAQARSLVDWHARHRHCAACGGPTRPVFGGSQRNCIECSSEHFPRTDPVAIAIVTRGSRCLLGRGRGWPERMHSALAGFVEPGETLEEAVRREVREEAGVVVGAVRYLISQPWPFPSSLMIGCVGEAQSEAIELLDGELESAAWFERDEIAAALAGEEGRLGVPPPMALAHRLLRAWLDGG